MFLIMGFLRNGRLQRKQQGVGSGLTGGRQLGAVGQVE